MSKSIQERWNDLSDINMSIHLAGITEANSALTLKRMIEENDTALMDLLEEKDKEAIIIQKKQDEEDERRLKAGHEVKIFDVSKLDDMNLEEVKDILKKVITCLQW